MGWSDGVVLSPVNLTTASSSQCALDLAGESITFSKCQLNALRFDW